MLNANRACSSPTLDHFLIQHCWWHPHARGRDTFYMRHACIEQKSFRRWCTNVSRAPRNSPWTAQKQFLVPLMIWCWRCLYGLLFQTFVIWICWLWTIKSLKADVYIRRPFFSKSTRTLSMEIPVPQTICVEDKIKTRVKWRKNI